MQLCEEWMIWLKAYDWYGAYGSPEHEDDGYADSLKLDYTFDHPQIQDNVSGQQLPLIWSPFCQYCTLGWPILDFFTIFETQHVPPDSIWSKKTIFQKHVKKLNAEFEKTIFANTLERSKNQMQI